MSKCYKVTLTFLDPTEGVVQICADDEEEAVNKVWELYQNRQGLHIVGIEEVPPWEVVDQCELFPIVVI